MKRGPPQPSSPTMTEIKGRLSFEKEKKKTQKERRSSRDWDNIPEAVGEEEDEENIEANHSLVALKPAKPARAASYRKPVEDASPLLSLDPHTEETPPLLDLLTNEEDHHNTAEPPFAELLTLKAYEDTPPPSSSEALTCEASESNPSSPASVTARVSIGTNTMPLPSSDVPTLQIPSPLPIPTTEDDDGNDIAARRARFLSFQKLPAVVIAGREEANGKPTTGHEDDDVDGRTALDVLRKGAAEGSVPPPPSPDLQAAGLRFTTTPTPLPAARTEPEAHEDQTHPSLHSSDDASRQSGEQNSGTKGKSDTRRKSYDPSSDKDVEVRYYGNQRVLVRKSNGGAPNKYF